MTSLPISSKVAYHARSSASSLVEQTRALTRNTAQDTLHYVVEHAVTLHTFAWYAKDRPADGWRIFKSAIRRHVLTLGSLLILLWLFTLYWGEVRVFNTSIEQCDWRYWESWPEGAAPHHLGLVADPQLVDPHTYIGRPWPLNSLTFAHTDAYIRRAYSRMQNDLDLDSVVLLGDLFDGGREWSTLQSQSPDQRWRGYGNSFWQKEFDRFSRIFFTDWRERPGSQDLDSESVEEVQDHVRIFASLPGNHDLGFSTGIQKPVRDRFVAYFGDSNRVDIIGNHTFVSVDTVSLSAKDAQSEQNSEEIWKPADDFLENAKDIIARTHGKYMALTGNKKLPSTKRHHVVEDVNGPLVSPPVTFGDPMTHPEFPLILLTHVPLFRNPGTPCGPLRERHSPTKPPPGQTEPVDPDPPNSINSLGAGVQYQNSVSRPISLSIIERLGGAVEYVFSGDDHDYCDVVHRAYPSPGSGIREITVKSISWAMGVRKPGFLLVSLWNEVDAQGRRVASPQNEDHSTMQTHLCLLPDQLAILIRYGILLGLSLIALLIRSIITVFAPGRLPISASNNPPTPLLPTQSTFPSFPASSKEKDEPPSYNLAAGTLNPSSSSSSSDESVNGARLSARNTGVARTRSPSPGSSYGYGFGTTAKQTQGPGLVAHARNVNDWEKDGGEDTSTRGKRKAARPGRRKGKVERVVLHFGWSVGRVGVVVVGVWVWLLGR
ncbi:MAG: hypothetical protein M1828_005322 [Chrysothrix sp. TS-e1954]|nr:MAG: hypothetical protein M1828_005322 [Chrysothrix sp. TS-e1954]